MRKLQMVSKTEVKEIINGAMKGFIKAAAGPIGDKKSLLKGARMVKEMMLDQVDNLNVG